MGYRPVRPGRRPAGPPVRGIGGPRQPAAGRPPAAGVLHGSGGRTTGPDQRAAGPKEPPGQADLAGGGGHPVGLRPSMGDSLPALLPLLYPVRLPTKNSGGAALLHRFAHGAADARDLRGKAGLHAHDL